MRRQNFPDSSRADPYDPPAMPEALTKAHQKPDAAVDAAYAKRTFTSDRDRVAVLFALHQQLSRPLESNRVPRRKRTG